MRSETQIDGGLLTDDFTHFMMSIGNKTEKMESVGGREKREIR